MNIMPGPPSGSSVPFTGGSGSGSASCDGSSGGTIMCGNCVTGTSGPLPSPGPGVENQCIAYSQGGQAIPILCIQQSYPDNGKPPR